MNAKEILERIARRVRDIVIEEAPYDDDREFGITWEQGHEVDNAWGVATKRIARAIAEELGVTAEMVEHIHLAVGSAYEGGAGEEDVGLATKAVHSLSTLLAMGETNDG